MTPAATTPLNGRHQHTLTVNSPGLFGRFYKRQATYETPVHDIWYNLGLRREPISLRQQATWEPFLRAEPAVRDELRTARHHLDQAVLPKRVSSRQSRQHHTQLAMHHVRTGLAQGGVGPQFTQSLKPPRRLQDVTQLSTLLADLPYQRSTEPLEQFFNRMDARHVSRNRLKLGAFAALGAGIGFLATSRHLAQQHAQPHDPLVPPESP